MNLMMLFIGDFTYPTRVLKPLLKLSLILSTPSDSPFFISFTLLTALDFILSIFSVTRFLISSNFFFIFDKKSVIPSKSPSMISAAMRLLFFRFRHQLLSYLFGCLLLSCHPVLPFLILSTANFLRLMIITPIDNHENLLIFHFLDPQHSIFLSML